MSIWNNPGDDLAFPQRFRDVSKTRPLSSAARQGVESKGLAGLQIGGQGQMVDDAKHAQAQRSTRANGGGDFSPSLHGPASRLVAWLVYAVSQGDLLPHPPEKLDRAWTRPTSWQTSHPARAEERVKKMPTMDRQLGWVRSCERWMGRPRSA